MESVVSPPLSVSLDDVMSWGPCYPESRLRELAAGRERITALEALDLPVPAKDRLWLVLREELVPAPILHEFACRCAESALDMIESKGVSVDPRSREALRVKRAWLRDEATVEELAAARAAAWAAAWAAAGDAAWDAAWAAAQAAARAAAWAAAGAAARAAARDEAREGQIEILRSLLTASL